MRSIRLPFLLISATLILITPLIAMQFSSEVDWGLLDFILAGILLYGTAFTINAILNKVQGRTKQILAIGISLLILLLIWAELAVGVFGTPFAGS
ncbi:MAG: hypothetical protein CMP59_04130 [Flavobacteriales bacterium]|nr:hypothetical protein [Flavobacteriales bacterium]